MTGRTGDAPDSLRDLQWHWGDAYLITGAAAHWIAHRRDNGLMLAAGSPEELRELIIEDYADQRVSRVTEQPSNP